MVCFEWSKLIKRKDDKITKKQALEFMRSLPKIGRNVDNCYIEPYDDAIDKVIDLIERLEEEKLGEQKVGKVNKCT